MASAEDGKGRAKRPVSERKVNANRANAQKSTGPRTPEGKWRVGRNAVKHGILAREVVIGEGDGAEREEDFVALQAGLYAAYAPRDAAEQLEVDNLVAAYWWLRRSYRAMTGDTRTGLDTVRRDWEHHRREHFEALLPLAAVDHGATLRMSSLGCAYLVGHLDAVTAALTTDCIPHAVWEPFLQFFPAAASVPSRLRVDWAARGEALSLDDDVRRDLAALVATERVALERAHAEAERHEQAELSAEAARLALPGAGAGERDLRYVTAFRKDIARTGQMLATLRQRPTVEPQDAGAAGGEGHGEPNEPEPRG